MHRASALQRADGLVSGLRDFLLPPACAVCREMHIPDRNGIVCPQCIARLVPLTHPLCTRCGHPRLSANAPLPESARAVEYDGADGSGSRASHRSDTPGTTPDSLPPCRWCDRLPAFVRAARSVCRMDVGTGGAMVHALKYAGWPGVAAPMATRMCRVDLPPDVVSERTALVPIPLARTRERERGYNQAERLATAMAPHWNIPVWRSVLSRRRDTHSQVRLTPSERASNVSNAFVASAHSRDQLRGAHVVLIDDVITTAATLNAAAHALCDGGARIISYVTFGRAPDTGDRTDFLLDLDRN